MVLGRSVLAAYEVLPAAERDQVRDVPEVVERLEKEAESLRAGGQTGERLAETVAALENGTGPGGCRLPHLPTARPGSGLTRARRTRRD